MSMEYEAIYGYGVQLEGPGNWRDPYTENDKGWISAITGSGAGGFDYALFVRSTIVEVIFRGEDLKQVRRSKLNDGELRKLLLDTAREEELILKGEPGWILAIRCT